LASASIARGEYHCNDQKYGNQNPFARFGHGNSLDDLRGTSCKYGEAHCAACKVYASEASVLINGLQMLSQTKALTASVNL